MILSLPRVILGGLALLTTVLGSPVPVAEPLPSAEVDGSIPETLQKRAAGGAGVYLCTDIKWGGYCEYGVYAFDQCWQTYGAFDYKISSFGVDSGAQCFFFYDRNCQDNGGTNEQKFAASAVWPGKGVLGSNWNDAIGSFRCVYFIRPG